MPSPPPTPLEFPIVGGGGMRGHPPPSNNFFWKTPHQNWCPLWGTPAYLKMKLPSFEKETFPLKHEAPFHEMIPRKSTINNHLKFS